MKQKRIDTIERIVIEYQQKHSLYEDFARRCEDLLRQLLDEAGVRVHSIQCRAKGVNDLREKLEKPDRRYQRLEDVTDLAGARVITYFADDVDRIGTVIEGEFAIDENNSIDKRKVMDPDRFGYLSLHYVCNLSEDRLRLPEYRRFGEFILEIQVRSILQHAWAEIEHDLGYKATGGVPAPIRRQFSRLAGLLELGDDEFMKLRDELESYGRHVAQEVSRAPATLPIDDVSLKVFLDHDPLALEVDESIARTLAVPLDRNWYAAGPPEWLPAVGLQTIADVQTALAARREMVLEAARLEEELQDQTSAGVARGIGLSYLAAILLAERSDQEALADRLAEWTFGSPGEFAKRLVDITRQSSGMK